MIKVNNKIKITFTGDIMCDNKPILEKVDYKNFISQKLKNLLNMSDYVVGNLETPIVENINLSGQYSFSAPPAFLQELKKSGFDLFSTANNHCLDCGFNGVIENNKNIKKMGMDFVGTNSSKDDSRVFIKKFNNMKFAFVSYTYGTNAFLNNNYLNKENSYLVNLSRKQECKNKIYRKIKNKFFENCYIYSYIRDRKYLKNLKGDLMFAKENADIVICLMHSGGQYNNKVEHYTKHLSNFIMKNGADIVIGNHPHVVLNHKNNIFYSLGNFYATPFSNHNQIDDIPSYSILLNYYFDKKLKKIDGFDYEIVKTIINEQGFPETKLVDELDFSDKIKNEIRIINDRVNR